MKYIFEIENISSFNPNITIRIFMQLKYIWKYISILFTSFSSNVTVILVLRLEIFLTI